MIHQPGLCPSLQGEGTARAVLDDDEVVVVPTDVRQGPTAVVVDAVMVVGVA